MMRPGMSAGEARAWGLTVPEHVPDCAVLEIDPTSEIESSVEPSGNRLPTIRLRIPSRWAWVEVKGVIDI